MKVSSRVTSRCFMFIYFLLSQLSTSYIAQPAQTSMRAEFSSGKLPTTRVRCRISRLSLSMTSYESFFYTTFPVAIPLDNGGLKGEPFDLGDLQGNIPGSGGEVAAVVAATVALALLITLVPGRPGQLLRFGLQQFIESFLYATSYKFLQFVLDYSLV